MAVTSIQLQLVCLANILGLMRPAPSSLSYTLCFPQQGSIPFWGDLLSLIGHQ